MITLDLTTISTPTIKGLRRQLLLELKATTRDLKTANKTGQLASGEGVRLRQAETQLITAISRMNVALGVNA